MAPSEEHAAIGLDPLKRRLHAAVEGAELPGAVALVMQHGELVRHDVMGWQNIEQRIPMQRNTIFRVASMSKPVTSVAVLMLVEQGRVALHDPVAQWLPELAQLWALPEPAAPLESARPARTPITVRHLLSHQAGFAYPGDPLLRAAGTAPDADPAADARTPLERAMESAGLHGQPEQAPDEWLRRLSALPLAHEPGTHWTYGFSTDVLGVLVARVSGQRLGAFLRDQLFGPLGMTDTGFELDAAQCARLASTYARPPDGRLVDCEHLSPRPWGYRRQSDFGSAPAFDCGGAGLVSTADDMLRFQQMLLQQGDLGGVRVLGPATVASMLRDQMTPAQRSRPLFGFAGMWAGMGFGLGVSVVDDAARHFSGEPAGSFGWGGLYGTSGTSVPATNMSYVFMTALHQADLLSTARTDFVRLLNAAPDDGGPARAG